MMKTILVLALLIAQTTSYAQGVDYTAYARKKFISEFSVCAGPSLSFLRGSPSVETNEVYTRYPRIGFTVGTSASCEITQNLELNMLILFEKKGGVVHFNTTYFDQSSQTLKTSPAKDEFIFTSFELPIFANYFLGKNNKTKVGAGPFGSYLQKQIIRKTLYPGGIKGYRSIEDQTRFNNRFEWGVGAQVTHEFTAMKNIPMSIGLYNFWGLTDTRKVKNYGPVKTNTTSILISVILK